jgi:PAS domain S-box-containing protein
VLPLYVFSVPSLVLMAAVAFELGADIVRALQMSARLQQSEAELRQSEQRMKLAADAASVGVGEWDMRRDRIWASERALALFGIVPHVDLGFERFIEALHVDHRPAARDAAEALRAHGGTIEQRVRVVLPDGTNRWLLTRGSTETDASGQPALLRGVAFDITERHRAERRYQRVVEEAPYGLLTADAEGVVDFANASAASIFRYSRDELVGRSLESLMPGCLGGPPCPDVNDATARKGTMPPFRKSVLGRRKDGSEGALEVGLNHIDGPNGAVLLAMVVDVSALKTANEQIERDRAFLRKVIDTIPGLFFAKDRDGRCPQPGLGGPVLVPWASYWAVRADVHAVCEEARRMRADDLDVMDNRGHAPSPRGDHRDRRPKRWTTVRLIVDASGQAVRVLGSSSTSPPASAPSSSQQRAASWRTCRVTMLSELSGRSHELNQPLAAISATPRPRSSLAAAGRISVRGAARHRQRRPARRRGDQGTAHAQARPAPPREFDPNDLVHDVLKLVRGDLMPACLTVDLAPRSRR